VAGPIERSTHLLPQFHPQVQKADAADDGLPKGVRAASTAAQRNVGTVSTGIGSGFDYNRVSSGLKLMLWGFFKKLVIADRLAIYVNTVYGAPAEHSSVALLIATYFFAFQIYCDFSAYSDIAIGAARVLGFDLMENFRRPYFSKSISEFWSRWHISLSTWFRDYLYIPLGGNRVSESRWYANLFIVFLVSGLWHGAAWTFVIWGALHGAYLMASLMTAPLRERLWAATRTALTVRLQGVHTAGPTWPSALPVARIRQWIAIGVTFHLVLVAWVFFRANSVSDALYVLAHMWAGTGSPLLPNFDAGALLLSVSVIAFMEIVHLAERSSSIEAVLDAYPRSLRWGFYYLLIGGILAFGVFSQQQFIYFQF
jgi:D-alanyl-lipoteichoic acid acyltransferase DltB (MBOAT superfamily)